MLTENRNPEAGNANALYRAVWRWHFFAGIFAAPFVVFLAVTGALYLWKPQFEEWKYAALLNVPVPAPTHGAPAAPLAPDAQFAAATAAFPELKPIQFLPAPRPGRSAEVQFGAARGADKRSVFVDPYSGRVLGSIDEATRPMAVLRELHGSMKLGKTGDLLLELAASWTFVLLATGFYLWWPRPFTVRGFLLPRLGSGRRALLRDLHAVPAIWLSACTLFLLVTGIQWTGVGGQWARILAQAAGEWQPRETQASAHRSELLGGWSPYLDGKAKAEQAERVASVPPAATDDPHAEHRARGSATAPDADRPRTETPRAKVPRLPLARVMEIASEVGVTDAYAIALPRGEAGVYSILTDRNRAFTRAYVHVDQYSGKILADIRYRDFGRIAKFYTFGIIAHEGQLFGLANQLLGLVTCLGLIGLVASGLWMWWSRRPAGKLGAPPAAETPLLRASKGALVLTLVLAALLPLVAASLLVLLALDLALVRDSAAETEALRDPAPFRRRRGRGAT